jgi:hypothetical protein
MTAAVGEIVQFVRVVKLSDVMDEKTLRPKAQRLFN